MGALRSGARRVAGPSDGGPASDESALHLRRQQRCAPLPLRERAWGIVGSRAQGRERASDRVTATGALREPVSLRVLGKPARRRRGALGHVATCPEHVGGMGASGRAGRDAAFRWHVRRPGRRVTILVHASVVDGAASCGDGGGDSHGPRDGRVAVACCHGQRRCWRVGRCGVAPATGAGRSTLPTARLRCAPPPWMWASVLPGRGPAAAHVPEQSAAQTHAQAVAVALPALRISAAHRQARSLVSARRFQGCRLWAARCEDGSACRTAWGSGDVHGRRATAIYGWPPPWLARRGWRKGVLGHGGAGERMRAS